MRIYLAATFKNQSRIRQMRDKLFILGHNVLSTWLNEQIKPNGMTEEQFGRKMAAKDLREIQEADCLILDIDDPSVTAGKMIEYGFALAHHKLLYTVGKPIPNAIFTLLADKHFDTWEDLFDFFAESHSTVDVDTDKYIKISKQSQVG